MLRLDPRRGVLTRGGELVDLVPKAVDLVRALAERMGRLVTKDELMAAIWPDVTVEEGNLAKLVFLVRRELGEDAIQTVPRRGYRLAIAVQVGEAPRQVTPAAYERYIEGRYYWNRRPGAVVWRALECFQAALDLDPTFALAWSGIADVYATLGSWEAGVLPHAEAHAKAWSYASHALELEPGLVEAQTTRAYTALHYAWDVDGAERGFAAVVRGDPSYAPAQHWHSHALAAAGRFDESLEASRRALACDPMNLLLHVHLAWHYLLAGEPTSAHAQAERVIAMDPAFHWGHYFHGWAADLLGDHARAVDSLRAACAASHDDLVMRAGLARTLAVGGDRAAALAIVRELEPLGRFDYELALVHAGLADLDSARAALTRARAARSGWMPYARRDARLAALPEARAALPAIAP